MAQLGITVVAVIHQPRHEIFQLFDDILMIAPGGVTAYLGPQAGVVDHFKQIGFVFDPYVNEADELMDILSGKGTKVTISKFKSKILFYFINITCNRKILKRHPTVCRRYLITGKPVKRRKHKMENPLHWIPITNR
jgi:ABC-type multidrug transport system ATPase subunit